MTAGIHSAAFTGCQVLGPGGMFYNPARPQPLEAPKLVGELDRKTDDHHTTDMVSLERSQSFHRSPEPGSSPSWGLVTQKVARWRKETDAQKTICLPLPRRTRSCPECSWMQFKTRVGHLGSASPD